jgi:hypothetical protein
MLRHPILLHWASIKNQASRIQFKSSVFREPQVEWENKGLSFIGCI